MFQLFWKILMKLTSFVLQNQRYKLVRLTPENEDQLKFIREWEHNPEVSHGGPKAYFYGMFDFFAINFFYNKV